MRRSWEEVHWARDFLLALLETRQNTSGRLGLESPVQESPVQEIVLENPIQRLVRRFRELFPGRFQARETAVPVALGVVAVVQ